MNPLCSLCGSEAVLKDGKFGKFYACPNWPICPGETLSHKAYQEYLSRASGVAYIRHQKVNIKASIDSAIQKIVPNFGDYVLDTFMDLSDEDLVINEDK